MSQPTPYNKTTTFANETFDQDFKDALDIELHNIETAIDETQTNLALVQRDDGALRNGIVTSDSLSAGLYTEILSDLAGTDLSSVTAEVAGYAADAATARDAAQDAQVIAEGYKNDAQGYATDAQGYAQDAQDAIDSLNQTTYEDVATAGQSQIIPGFTFDNAAGNIRVYIDGVIQPPSTYTLPNTTTIALSSALAGGEDILVFSVDFTAAPSTPLYVSNNLSDLSNVATARTNLGLGDLATEGLGTDSGLEFSADGLEVLLASNAGLSKSASGLAVKLKTGGGIAKDADGLSLTGGGSAWEEVTAAKATASNSAAIEFTGLSAGYDYAVVCDNAIPQNAQPMFMQVGTGAGPTYITANYHQLMQEVYVGGGATDIIAVSSSAAACNITGSAVKTAGNIGVNFEVLLQNVGANVNKVGSLRHAVYSLNVDATTGWFTAGYMFPTTSAITAVKFYMATGNIVSGVFRLYRRAKS